LNEQSVNGALKQAGSTFNQLQSLKIDGVVPIFGCTGGRPVDFGCRLQHSASRGSYCIQCGTLCLISQLDIMAGSSAFGWPNSAENSQSYGLFGSRFSAVDGRFDDPMNIDET